MRKKIFILVFFGFIFIVSCGKSLPETRNNSGPEITENNNDNNITNNISEDAQKDQLYKLPEIELAVPPPDSVTEYVAPDNEETNINNDLQLPELENNTEQSTYNG